MTLRRYTNVRPTQFDAGYEPDRQCPFEGLTAVMLSIDLHDMGGTDCFVAYLIPNHRQHEFDGMTEGFDFYFQDKHGQQQTCWHLGDDEPAARAFVDSFADPDHFLYFIPEERCYLKPHDIAGAQALFNAELAYSLKCIDLTVEEQRGSEHAEHLINNHIPYQAEKLGRVTARCAPLLFS